MIQMLSPDTSWPVVAEDVGAASLNAANDLISVFGDTPLSTFLAKCAHCCCALQRAGQTHCFLGNTATSVLPGCRALRGCCECMGRPDASLLQKAQHAPCARLQVRC